ncbi:MAG: type ISP restriction/modification enzyme [Microscillaceae bacterium]|nr:type ISP restriction/modification enzyme [Microscillaceae bacterium]
MKQNFPVIVQNEADFQKIQKLLNEIYRCLGEGVAACKKKSVIQDLLSAVNPSENTQNEEFERAYELLWGLSKESFGLHYKEADLLEDWLKFLFLAMLWNETPGGKSHLIGHSFEQVNAFARQQTFHAALPLLLEELELHVKNIQRLSVEAQNKLLENLFPSHKTSTQDIKLSKEEAQWILESVDFLWMSHFSQKITQKDLPVLFPEDPQSQLLKTFLQYLPKNRLKNKYSQEILAYEPDLLSYFLNLRAIEQFYRQETDQNEAFQHLFWSDALHWDAHYGIQKNLFKGQDAHSQELYRQAQRKISLILADIRTLPSKSIPYPDLDLRIKNTYLKQNPSAVTKDLLRPLTRFLRWCSDRVQEPGLVMLATSKDLLEKPAYFALRKGLSDTFGKIYILEKENELFLWLLKIPKLNVGQVFYAFENSPKNLPAFERLFFEEIIPDAQANWRAPKSTISTGVFTLYPNQNKPNKEQPSVFSQVFSGIRHPENLWDHDIVPKSIAKEIEAILKKNKPNSEKPKKPQNGQIQWFAAPSPAPQPNLKKTFESKRLLYYSETPFQNQRLYWHPELIEAKDFYLGENPPEKPIPTILLGKNHTEIFLTESLPGHRFLPQLKVLPLKCADESGSLVFNISQAALQKFKRHYEEPWQEKANLHQEYLNKLLNFGEFENCQVEPELVQELRRLIQWGENPNQSDHLFKNINQPQSKTEELFKKLVQEFRQVKKVFERIGKRCSRSKESYDILANYFEQGEIGAEAILDFFYKDENRLDIRYGLENEIREEDIFYYVYAVLHDEKHQASLSKDQFAEFPLYLGFWQWVAWGRELADLYVNYAAQEPWKLRREESSIRKKPVDKLRLRIEEVESYILLQYQYRVIRIDGFPAEVWETRLGGLGWIYAAVEAVRKRKISEENENFSLDLFVDELQHLLERICRTSLKMQEIIRQMKKIH